jgi:hypothetical protein
MTEGQLNDGGFGLTSTLHLPSGWGGKNDYTDHYVHGFFDAYRRARCADFGKSLEL